MGQNNTAQKECLVHAGLTLTPTEIAELDAMAEAEHRSRAQMARVLLREAIEARKEAAIETT